MYYDGISDMHRLDHADTLRDLYLVICAHELHVRTASCLEDFLLWDGPTITGERVYMLRAESDDLIPVVLSLRHAERLGEPSSPRVSYVVTDARNGEVINVSEPVVVDIMPGTCARQTIGALPRFPPRPADEPAQVIYA